SACVGVAAIARAHSAVPAIATRVVRVRPSRSARRPNTTPPAGLPNSIATMISAPVDAVAAGPASTSIAGASAVTGRNTWMLSMRFPTTPARSAALPSGGSDAAARGVLDEEEDEDADEVAVTSALIARLLPPAQRSPQRTPPDPPAAPARRTPAHDGTRGDTRAQPPPGPRPKPPRAPPRRRRARPAPPRRIRDHDTSATTPHRDARLAPPADRPPPARTARSRAAPPQPPPHTGPRAPSRAGS